MHTFANSIAAVDRTRVAIIAFRIFDTFIRFGLALIDREIATVHALRDFGLHLIADSVTETTERDRNKLVLLVAICEREIRAILVCLTSHAVRHLAVEAHSCVIADVEGAWIVVVAHWIFCVSFAAGAICDVVVDADIG